MLPEPTGPTLLTLLSTREQRAEPFVSRSQPRSGADFRPQPQPTHDIEIGNLQPATRIHDA